MAGNKPGPAPREPGVQRERLATTERGYATVQLPEELAQVLATYGEQLRIPPTRRGNPHYGAIIARRFASLEVPAAAPEFDWDRLAQALVDSVGSKWLSLVKAQAIVDEVRKQFE